MNKQAKKSEMNPAVQALLMGLAGAGVGGIGTHMFTNKEKMPGESDEERQKRLKESVVLGAMLGGAGGAALPLSLEFLNPAETRYPIFGAGTLLGAGAGALAGRKYTRGAIPSFDNLTSKLITAYNKLDKAKQGGSTAGLATQKRLAELTGSGKVKYKRWGKETLRHSPLYGLLLNLVAGGTAGRYAENLIRNYFQVL